MRQVKYVHRRGCLMDAALLARVRALAVRRRLPVLWLFTDAERLPDPCAAAARLPRRISGIVLRHDEAPGRAELAHSLARICRERRLALVIAGDVRLAAHCGAGVHLRGGRWDGPLRRHALVTSSAHGPGELRRAARAGADLVFLSPIFPTESHPGTRVLGAARWAGLARRSAVPVAALGGVDGQTVRRIPLRICHGIGAIGALA
jgi:thiamine-phosphate pyrophosphorylase